MSDDTNKQDLEARLSSVPPAAEVELPSAEERAKLLYVVESLVGSLDYAGVKQWLDCHPTLEQAWQAARSLRDGMTAT